MLFRYGQMRWRVCGARAHVTPNAQLFVRMYWRASIWMPLFWCPLLINLQTRVSERLGCQAHARAHVQCFRNNTLTNVSPNFVQFAGNNGMSRQESEKAFINGWRKETNPWNSLQSSSSHGFLSNHVLEPAREATRGCRFDSLKLSWCVHWNARRRKWLCNAPGRNYTSVFTSREPNGRLREMDGLGLCPQRLQTPLLSTGRVVATDIAMDARGRGVQDMIALRHSPDYIWHSWN